MKHNKEENKKVVFLFGLISLLVAFICLFTRFNMFMFFMIIFIICFRYSEEEYKKFFLNPTIKIIIKSKKRQREIEKEIKKLNQERKELQEYLEKKNKYFLELKQYNQTKNELEKNIKNLTYKEIEQQEKILKDNNLEIQIKEKENQTQVLTETIQRLKKEKSNLKETIEELEEIKYFKKETTSEYIDSLEGIEFESFITQLLKYLGFNNVYKTPKSGDYGVDIIAEKNNVKYAIQCKRYINAVGNKAIQEVYSGKDFYECHVAIVATNSYFTNNAIRQAEKNKVVLWDRNDIMNMIKSIK